MLDRARDYTTKEGAHMLADTIQRFWSARGKRVRVQVVPASFTHNASDGYVVKSNMRGGQP